MLIQMANNQQVDEMEKQQAIPSMPPPTSTRLMTRLSAYVRECWNKAYEAKQPIQIQLLTNLRSFNAEYDPMDLQEIRKLQGSETFLSLTPTKCIAVLSWLTDIYDQPNPPFDIDPTPRPELPIELENQIRIQVIQEITGLINQYCEATGNDPQEVMMKALPDVRRRIQEKITDKAKTGIDELKLTMSDQLTEGGWYEAFDECLFDMVVYKAAILKGPIFRKQRRFKRVLSPSGHMYENSIQDVVIPTFERRSPFNIYPAPQSVGAQSGYLCDLDSLSVKQLYNLIGVEGFNEAAIRRVISIYKNGGLREWARMSFETTKLQAEQQSTMLDDNMIDVVEFWGDVAGDILLEEGMSRQDIPDPDKRYDVCVWLVGGEVIKAMLNPNPMGLKPYVVRSYVTIPGLFWGKSLPELISDLQRICNAITRAIINNAAMSSGPLVELDSERIPLADRAMYPWKVIESTDKQMTGSPAVRYYQPENTAVALTKVLDVFIRLADQYSVPSYSHGDTNIRGAGKTASGLSMLMSSANRVVKRVVKNADDLVKSSVTHLFFYNVYFNADQFTFIGDVNVVAKGIGSVIQEEQQAMRRIEFLNATNNDIDAQILGREGRRELLREVAATIDLDELSKVLPIIDSIDGLRAELEQIIAQQQQVTVAQAELDNEVEKEKIKAASKGVKIKGKAPAKKPIALDLAGNQQSGQAARLFKQESVGQM